MHRHLIIQVKGTLFFGSSDVANQIRLMDSPCEQYPNITHIVAGGSGDQCVAQAIE
jgi:hypothetical protein